jgi:uncharacterized protein (TIGR03382 family)
VPLVFAILPDLYPPSACAGGCGTAATTFGNVTAVLSHALIESVTDPLISSTQVAIGSPMAWYAPGNSCGEIGDICNQQTGVIAGYTVQKEWSNRLGACILTDPNTPSICAGPSDGGCRPCTYADNGVGCNGTTPVCEFDGGSPLFGHCVPCIANAQCSAGMVCNPAIDQCQSAPDAGGTPDSGSNADAGTQLGPDSGASDAGITAGAGKGCGCSHPGAPILSLAALILLGLRPRKRDEMRA